MRKTRINETGRTIRSQGWKGYKTAYELFCDDCKYRSSAYFEREKVETMLKNHTCKRRRTELKQLIESSKQSIARFQAELERKKQQLQDAEDKLEKQYEELERLKAL